MSDKVIEVLKKAIEMKLPISFEYCGPKHVEGVRFGNPHAIFIHPTTNNVNIDIWKTGGVSTKPEKELPDWRQYRIEFIMNPTILNDKEQFAIAPGYKPYSAQYQRPIAKV